MKSLVINVKNDLLKSFHTMNDALKKDKHLFHKKHRFELKPQKAKTQKAKTQKSKTQKRKKVNKYK